MNKTLKTVIFALVVLVIIFLIYTNKNQNNGDTIKVGIVHPLTGTAAAYGEEGKNSVVLALDEINAAGGINGKKIEYIIEDGKCDGPTAISAYNKLTRVDKVSVVFGGGCSTETMAIAPLASNAKVPLLTVFTTAPVVPNEGEWLFRHISTNAYYGTKLGELAYKNGYRKVAVLTEVRDFPVSYSDAFIKSFKAAGGEIVLDERFAPDTKDYRTVALKMKGVKSDAVFISPQGADVMALLTNQLRDLGVANQAMFFNHAFAPAKYLSITNGYMPSKYLIVQPFADVKNGKTKTFTDAYVKKYGKVFNFNTFFVAADYDMAYRFRDAATMCTADGKALTSSCIRDAFKNAKTYSGAAGDVTISSEYSPYGVLTPIAITKVVGDKQEFELVK